MKLRWIVVLALLPLLAPSLRAEDEVRIKEDVIYGRKDGMALTFDVLTPPKPNGAAVLWIQSGGWYSRWAPPRNMAFVSRPFLDKGFTVFIVYHGSAPKYHIPEIVEDVRRAVRVIHLRAREFGVDSERLGVLGGSAGGHLSLVLGTTGDDGDPKAKDPVLRQSSRVAAVVALFPPTDIRKWVSHPPANIKRFSALHFDPKKAEDYSPALKVTEKTAATLLIHGDKDDLVPIEHSRWMIAALEKAKVKSKLVVVEGAKHGFSPEQNRKTVVPAMVDWFVKQLAKKTD
jgi:dipeptidyl aminopeptidase/acylaminoacyl peptidase